MFLKEVSMYSIVRPWNPADESGHCKSDECPWCPKLLRHCFHIFRL